MRNPTKHRGVRTGATHWGTCQPLKLQDIRFRASFSKKPIRNIRYDTPVDLEFYNYKPAMDTPERRMLLAMVHRSVQDYLTLPTDQWASNQEAIARTMPGTNRRNILVAAEKNARDAWEWLTSEERTPYAYQWVCDYCELPRNLADMLELCRLVARPN